jgi:regulatory protein
MAEAVADISAADIRRAAMDLLARREHSYRELGQKLTLRFPGSNLIYTELNRLRDEKLQSDRRFAEAYLHSRSQRLYGPSRIKAELRERGIANDIIAAVSAEADIDWSANKRQLLQNKFGGQSAVDFSAIDFKERGKRLRFLQYRGFSTEFGSDDDL